MSKPKKKFITILVSVIAVLLVVAAGLALVPNPLRTMVLSEAKAQGYLEYKPTEAYEMANRICTQCHSVERIKLYCPRCGPPFVTVVPHMQSFIMNYRKAKPNLEFENITEFQAVAIAQVWNALVGNWEGDFRKQDMLKLIGSYKHLRKLYETPVSERKIESALLDRDDLKIGHMSGLEDMQKNLGKPENNMKNPCEKKMEMDHSQMDHSKMDHSKMDHSNMDHSKMKH